MYEGNPKRSQHFALFKFREGKASKVGGERTSQRCIKVCMLQKKWSVCPSFMKVELGIIQ